MNTRPIERAPQAHRFPLLIKHLLKAPLKQVPQQEIVYRDRVRYTYRDLFRRVCRLAGALKALGVKPGDTVAVMDWDSHRYLECFFAIPMMGAVLHTVNIRLSPEQILYTLNHAEAETILVHTDFLPILEAVRDHLKAGKRFVLLADDPGQGAGPLSLAGEYEALLARAEDAFDFPDFDEDSMATTFYTIGTTGTPKGVYFSHRQLVLHTHGLLSAFTPSQSQVHLDAGDVYMPLTPMFHVHAWGLPYLCTLIGTKQVYPGRYEPEMLLRLLTGEKVSFSHCIPTIMHMIVENPAARKANLAGWQVVIGGARLAPDLCRAALSLGINIYSAYGLSETCPFLTVASLKPPMLSWDAERQVEYRCRTGLPIPMVELDIVDPDGEAVPHDGTSTGEVVVRAPWLTQGYAKDPGESDVLWQDGWLHTGDIGSIDAEGYLQVTDRMKDVIKTGGEWISSFELEDLICRHPAVRETAVIGVPDPKWGERPMALVVLKEEYKAQVDEGEIKAFLQQSVAKGMLPAYGIPDKLLLVDTLAKSGVGKVNKQQLRTEYQQAIDREKK